MRLTLNSAIPLGGTDPKETLGNKCEDEDSSQRFMYQNVRGSACDIERLKSEPNGQLRGVRHTLCARGSPRGDADATAAGAGAGDQRTGFWD